MSGLISVITVGLAASASTGLGPGQLDPNHIALVFNGHSRISGELALFYADRRGVPKTQMIGLDLPMAETLRRVRYEPDVARPIREWLIRTGLSDRIVCLTTFYDVPIRVGKQPVTPEMRAARTKVERQRAEALEEVEQLLAEVAQIAPPTTRPTTTRDASAAAKDAAEIRKRFRATLVQALRRASRLGDPAAARAAKRQLLGYMERAQGISGILPHLRQTDQGDTHLGQAQLKKLRLAVREGQAKINHLLRAGPLAPEREQARRLIKHFAGLIGLLAHLEQDIKRLKGADTVASLDGELSALWAPPKGPYRWRINTLNTRHRANQALQAALEAREWQVPVLMISRLDGPNPRVVRRIIDEAISTEKVGLKGHAYFDARGLTAGHRPGSYGFYDQDLRDLARLCRDKTPIPTVLDNRKELFRPGACPDAALYCGWYSLGQYRDAFTFVRGAVAFHIASSEAVSLRDPKRRYWCKELLADGAAVTLGPVAEPYLSAFPRPSDFFGLLMTGRYSLVECFYYTKPYNSWMMMLIGDPLYRPFAVNPQLTLQDVFPADVLPLKPVPTSQHSRSRSTSRPVAGR